MNGPRAPRPRLAIDLFWHNHDLKNKENEMSNADYKRGVEDTVREIEENLPLSGMDDPLDVINAIPHFVRKKLLTNKENEMYVPSNPHEAYAFGVKKATEPISVNNIADAYVNSTLADRRKILLTKKATKWAAWYNNDKKGGPLFSMDYSNPEPWGGFATRLYDTQEQALAAVRDLSDPKGAFPFEVEVEL
jgi:hypothetical protein